MVTKLLPKQQRQLESFWELLLTSDVAVQKGVYMLLAHKYGGYEDSAETSVYPFLKMQGRLKVHGDEATDKVILQEHLQEKYGA